MAEAQNVPLTIEVGEYAGWRTTVKDPAGAIIPDLSTCAAVSVEHDGNGQLRARRRARGIRHRPADFPPETSLRPERAADELARLDCRHDSRLTVQSEHPVQRRPPGQKAFLDCSSTGNHERSGRSCADKQCSPGDSHLSTLPIRIRPERHPPGRNQPSLRPLLTPPCAPPPRTPAAGDRDSPGARRHRPLRPSGGALARAACGAPRSPRS